MKKAQRIKLILDLINKKRKTNPKKETFQFQYEELTKLPLLNDQVMLNQLLKRIQEESKCIIFILPKTPEHLLGKRIITIKNHGYRLLRQLGQKDETEVEVDEETFKLLSTIAVHIEDFEKFDKYNKKIKTELKEEKVSILILNNNGELYNKDNKENRLYPMNIKQSRYRIVRYLATTKDWVESRELAEECEVDPKKIGKTIEQIRRQMEKFIKVEGNKIIESKKGLGYRIKNIKIKKN